MKYFYKDIPGSGIHIRAEKEGKEYEIAIMRWTDGLNPEVEKAVETSARLIVACLNYCRGIPLSTLEGAVD